MANKFTKSVLERQAKEARFHTAPAAQPQAPAKPKEALSSESLQDSLPTEPSQQPFSTPAKETDLTEVPETAFDLQTLFASTASRTARNKTFYLDQTVIDAIHRTAKAQKTTDSKLVNEILKKILGC